MTTAIDTDLSCIYCGYNLRTQSADGTCPECGAAVSESLQDFLRHCGSRNLAVMRTGVVMLALGVAMMALQNFTSLTIQLAIVTKSNYNFYDLMRLAQTLVYFALFFVLILRHRQTLTWRGWMCFLNVPVLIIAAGMNLYGIGHGTMNYLLLLMFNTCSLAVGIWLITASAVNDPRKWTQHATTAALCAWGAACICVLMLGTDISPTVVARGLYLFIFLIILTILHQLTGLARMGQAHDLTEAGTKLFRIARIVFVITIGMSLLLSAAYTTGIIRPQGHTWLSIVYMVLGIARLAMYVWILHFFRQFARHLRQLIRESA